MRVVPLDGRRALLLTVASATSFAFSARISSWCASSASATRSSMATRSPEGSACSRRLAARARCAVARQPPAVAALAAAAAAAACATAASYSVPTASPAGHPPRTERLRWAVVTMSLQLEGT